jgi:hypothetical protein
MAWSYTEYLNRSPVRHCWGGSVVRAGRKKATDLEAGSRHAMPAFVKSDERGDSMSLL